MKKDYTFIYRVYKKCGEMLLSAENRYSQQKEISVRLDNVTIRRAFSIIEESSDYVFLVADDVSASLNRHVTFECNKEPITRVLDALFHKTDLEYRVMDRQVAVYRDKQEASPMSVSSQQPEDIVIRGKVVDATNKPLIGVSIQVKGTTQGSVTDMDGNFVLSLK